VDDEEGLDIWLLVLIQIDRWWKRHTFETDNTPHDFIDFLDVHVRVVLTDRVFLFHKCQPSSDDQEYQGPESQVPAERDESVFEGSGSEVLVSSRQQESRELLS
jgi:hypothetical protein